MASKNKINIISKFTPEFSSNITVDNVLYHVQTEDMGIKSHNIISRVFLKGEVMLSRKTDYSHLLKLEKSGEMLSSLMESHHKATIDIFIKEKSRTPKLKAEYFEDIKQLLRRGNGKAALKTLREALEQFPSDPFLLSYYGCLISVVENNTSEGIRICREALDSLKKAMPFGSEFFHPVFYLNLGRAYLKSGDKTEAVSAFHEGLKYDPENHDLQWELKKLGSRKKAPLPFLERSNPINKYIGLLRSKVTK